MRIHYGARIPRKVRRTTALRAAFRLISLESKYGPGFGARLHSIGNSVVDGRVEEDRLAATSLGNCVLKRIFLSAAATAILAILFTESSRAPYEILTQFCAFTPAKFIDPHLLVKLLSLLVDKSRLYRAIVR